MDEVTQAAAQQVADDEFWAGVMEEDTIDSFTGANWQGFLPPPPRPSFLDQLASPDGLTTCDLCSWAYQDGANSLEVTAAEAAADPGWAVTLAVVSLLSAAIGAAIMVTVLHCRSRLSSGFGSAGLCTLCVGRPHGRVSAPTSPLAPSVRAAEDKEARGAAPQDVSGSLLALWRAQWPWRRGAAGPVAAGQSKGPAPENHYTLEELAYSGGASDEALYAELDRPASYQYQNAACHCPLAAPADTPSAPSSAYYSDLSAPDRTYEAVGNPHPAHAHTHHHAHHAHHAQLAPCLSLQVNPHWEAAAAAAEAARRRQIAHHHLQRQFQQLQHIQMAPAAACDANSVPSDYV